MKRAQVDEDDNEDEEDDDSLQSVELGEELDLLPNPLSLFLSHHIQFVFKDGLNNADQVKQVLGKITRLVSQVHHSTKASDGFEDDQLQMANATRRNSQLTMIKSLLHVFNSTMERLECDVTEIIC